jgi:hypothetical protein
MLETLRIGHTVYDNLAWLDPRIVKEVDEALAQYSACRFDSAISRGGVALELLCTQIIEHLAGTEKVPSHPTLGSFTVRAENAPKTARGPLQEALSMSANISEREIEAVVERLRQATRTRNKGSHGEASPLLHPTEGDALQLLNILAKLVEWCGKKLFDAAPDRPLEPRIRIFLSIGNPHRLDQRQFLEKLRMYFSTHEVDLVTLNGYSEDKPFDQIKNLMKTCAGAIVVGWERYHAYTLFERERSAREALHQDRLLPTAWNHIEGSMAAVMNLPVLVLRADGLMAEGIFEAANHTHRIVEFNLAEEAVSLSLSLRETLKGWISKRMDVAGAA